jgi:hypothetical protein
MKRNNTAAGKAVAVGVLLAGMVLSREAGATLTLQANALITNFVSATYALPSGAAGFGTNKTCFDIFNVACIQSRWICVTDIPQLCMSAWKLVNIPTPPTTNVVSGQLVCFEIGFCNCGSYSGFSVTLTDAIPANTVKADDAAGPPSKLWINGGYGNLGGPMWATAQGGPWYVTDSSAGQIGPLYMRWIFGRVGMRKTGFVRYCVTIL